MTELSRHFGEANGYEAWCDAVRRREGSISCTSCSARHNHRFGPDFTGHFLQFPPCYFVENCTTEYCISVQIVVLLPQRRKGVRFAIPK